MDRRNLTDQDIRTKFITPALRGAGWDEMAQLREEVTFTARRIVVRGKIAACGKGMRIDYVLYVKQTIPVAVIKAKDNNLSVGAAMQEALVYAETRRIPFAFSSNGGSFVFHDRTGASAAAEVDLPLDALPSTADLRARYRAWKGLTPETEAIILQDYYDDSGKTPRYYLANAVSTTVEAIAKEQDHILFVTATGTGKTYTAFQITWRLWKAGRMKHILSLAERQRFIATADPLMALCDRMETGLDLAGQARDLLLDALLHESFGSHDATAIKGGRDVAELGE